MEAFACIRVRIVSIGWMARVEIPPDIQPAVKSIQDDSLDIVVCDDDEYHSVGGGGARRRLRGKKLSS